MQTLDIYFAAGYYYYRIIILKKRFPLSTFLCWHACIALYIRFLWRQHKQRHIPKGKHI